MNVAIDELREVTRRAIAAQGFDQADTAVMLDIIMYAQLRGNNQNVIKLLGAGMPANPDAGEITLAKDTKLSALIDGGWNQGMVVLTRATQLAIDKAQARGFGIVGTQRTNSPTGAIGYYARWIAEQGLIGFVCSGAPELMAMHGSYQPFLGTNPAGHRHPLGGQAAGLRYGDRSDRLVRRHYGCGRRRDNSRRRRL